MQQQIKNHPYTSSHNFDFENLCTLLSNEQFTLAAEKIIDLSPTIDLDSLAFDEKNYTRNIIIDSKKYWLGLMNWSEGALTSIHGHPELNFVYVIKGQLQCRNFVNESLLELPTTQLSTAEYRYNKGTKGRMDNNIHQIKALTKSVSLHFYSNNPTKGEVFDV